jgi:arylsulfatase A-like enzyme
MVQHKAPHRNWMPAARHLKLYADIKMPEPSTLFDKWEDNSPAARNQELEVDRHMHINYDLFVDLTPDFADDKSAVTDKSAFRNMRRMTDAQLRPWFAHYQPLDKALHDAKLSGKELVRWKYQRYAKNYLRCVKGVDESVGKLRKTLKELGLSDNTVVIYSSDQGFYIGDHGWYDKRWMYEESLKMPLVVSWPGVTKPGSKSEAMVQNLDYAQTFLDLAGAPQPDDMQGISLKPLLEGKTPEWRKSIYYHYYEHPSVHMVPRHYGVRTERYKLIHFYQFDDWEFYDLITDPDELDNLYNKPEHQTIIAETKKELARLRKTYQDDSNVSIKDKVWQNKFWKVK